MSASRWLVRAEWPNSSVGFVNGAYPLEWWWLPAAASTERRTPRRKSYADAMAASYYATDDPRHPD